MSRRDIPGWNAVSRSSCQGFEFRPQTSVDLGITRGLAPCLIGGRLVHRPAEGVPKVQPALLVATLSATHQPRVCALGFKAQSRQVNRRQLMPHLVGGQAVHSPAGGVPAVQPALLVAQQHLPPLTPPGHHGCDGVVPPTATLPHLGALGLLSLICTPQLLLSEIVQDVSWSSGYTARGALICKLKQCSHRPDHYGRNGGVPPHGHAAPLGRFGLAVADLQPQIAAWGFESAETPALTAAELRSCTCLATPNMIACSRPL